MEHLDELSLGIRGEFMGKDKDCPPVASPTTADHMASMMDVLQTTFYALYQTLVDLSLAIKQEQDPSLSKLNSRDLPPGAPLCTMPQSALR